MENFELVLKILGLIGTGGIVAIALKHYLSGANRKDNRIKSKTDLLAKNVKMLENFNNRIMELEVEVLGLRRKDNKNSDRVLILLEKIERLRQSIKSIKKITKEELDYLESKITELETMLNQKI